MLTSPTVRTGPVLIINERTVFNTDVFKELSAANPLGKLVQNTEVRACAHAHADAQHSTHMHASLPSAVPQDSNTLIRCPRLSPPH